MERELDGVQAGSLVLVRDDGGYHGRTFLVRKAVTRVTKTTVCVGEDSFNKDGLMRGRGVYERRRAHRYDAVKDETNAKREYDACCALVSNMKRQVLGYMRFATETELSEMRGKLAAVIDIVNRQTAEGE